MNGVFIGTDSIYNQGKTAFYYYIKNMNYVDSSQKIEDIERQIIEKCPEYIYVSMSSYILDNIKPLYKFGVPVLIGSGDPWGRLFGDKFREYIIKHKIDGIVVNNHCEIEAYKEYFKGIDLDYIWYPYGIDPEIMKDYKEEKIWDVIFSGKFSRYMFRRELDYIFSIEENINYKRFRPLPITNIPYDEYAMNINKSWIGIGGCIQSKEDSYYKDHFIGFLFPKSLEISACNTVLLNCHFGDEDIMGYIDGENCILFSTLTEACQKVLHYLNHKDELIDISKNGYKLIHDNYTYDKLSDSFIKDIEELYA